MFCFDFSDKVVALTANRKQGISKFYELLSEPQTNQPQFITECCHCVYKYSLLLQTFNRICTGAGGKFAPPLSYFNIAPKRKQIFALMHPDC